MVLITRYKLKLILLLIIFLLQSTIIYSSQLNIVNTFIKNEGQIEDKNIQYYSMSKDLNIYFQSNRISFSFNNIILDKSNTAKFNQFRFDMVFNQSNPKTTVLGVQKEITKLNFYSNNLPNGIKDVTVYNELVYKDIFNGIDLHFKFEGNNLKYYINKHNHGLVDFSFSFDGIRSLEPNTPDNSLIKIVTDAGEILLNSELTNGSTRYLASISSNNNKMINFINQNEPSQFELQSSKSQEKLLSSTLSFITYLGGSSFDHLYCIDADENANLLLCGLTNSNDFPTTLGSYQPQKGGGEDAIILKLNKDSKIDWCTFIGGSAADRAINVFKRDSVIWVSGESLSHDFPITPNAHQKYNAGGSADILIMRLDNNGHLLHATYHGGHSYDSSPDLAVDSKFNVWLIGRTFSGDFPVTLNAYYPSKGSFYDAFMISLDIDGNLRYSSFFPGNQDVLGEGIAIDSSDNVCITGYTLTENLPVTSNAYQPNKKDKYDAYLAKFTNIGRPIWITYFGGNQQDYGSNLTVDPYGNFFIFGFTNSTDLPTNNNVFQQNLNGAFDSFIAKFNNDGEFQWVSYFGGSGLEGIGEGLLYQIGGVKSDKYGNILVSGQTRSNNMPITEDAFQKILNGPTDSFIAKFDVNGKLLYSTFLGGSSNDRGYDVVFDNEGYLVNVGWTESSDFPVTDNAFQKEYNGNIDSYIFRFKECEEFYEYELLIPNDTLILASKNNILPLMLSVKKGSSFINKLIVKLRFVNSYYDNIEFSSGQILNKEFIDKFVVYEIEFANINLNTDIIELCKIKFDSKLPSDFKTKIEFVYFDWSTDCANTLIKDSELLSECDVEIQTNVYIKDNVYPLIKNIVVPLYLQTDDTSKIFINYNNVITISYLKSRAELIDVTHGFIIAKTINGNNEECTIKLNNLQLNDANNIISNLTFEFKDFDKSPFNINIKNIKWYEPCIESSLKGGIISRNCEELHFKLDIPLSEIVKKDEVNILPIYLLRQTTSSEKRIINISELELKVSDNIKVESFDNFDIISQVQENGYEVYKIRRIPFENDGNPYLLSNMKFKFNSVSFEDIKIEFSNIIDNDNCNLYLLGSFNIKILCDKVRIDFSMADTTVSFGNQFSRKVYLKFDKSVPMNSPHILKLKIKSKNNLLKINSIENVMDVSSEYIDNTLQYTVVKQFEPKILLDSININFSSFLDDSEFGQISIYDLVSDYSCLEFDLNSIHNIEFMDICEQEIRYIQLFKRNLMQIHPNPAYERANLIVKSIDNGYVNLSITNIFGEIIYTNNWYKPDNSEQLVQEFELNLRNLSSGLYLIHLQTSKNTIFEKLIINK